MNTHYSKKFKLFYKIYFIYLFYFFNLFAIDLTDDSDNPDFLPKKEFVFTFSPSEWQQIQPQEVIYKANDKNRPMRSCRSYYVLPKGSWTPLLAEHFWDHTNLPCCISFKRAKVFTEGNVYICVIGRCSICCSHFKGIVKEKPSGNSRFVKLITFNIIYNYIVYESENIDKKYVRL